MSQSRPLILFESSDDSSDDEIPDPSPFSAAGAAACEQRKKEAKQPEKRDAPPSKRPRIDTPKKNLGTDSSIADRVERLLYEKTRGDNIAAGPQVIESELSSTARPGARMATVQDSSDDSVVEIERVENAARAAPQAKDSPATKSSEESSSSDPGSPRKTENGHPADSPSVKEVPPPRIPQDVPVDRKPSPPNVEKKASAATQTKSRSDEPGKQPPKNAPKATTSKARKKSPDTVSEGRMTRNKSGADLKDAASGGSAASEVITKYVTLPSIPQSSKRLQKLTRDELEELEKALLLEEEDGWRQDWMGNLAFMHKDVPNPTSSKKPGAARLTFWEWALGSTVGEQCRRLLQNLFVHVYHMEGTPAMAKMILADSIRQHGDDPNKMVNAVHRLSHDPVVLQQDGWTTAKAAKPQGASGGAFHIGTHIVWQKFEAVVIAYDHDFDIGDLWKCMWLEEYETFDLEAEELQQAMKKYQRKKNQPQTTNTSSRYTASTNYAVEGIEHGIVLAGSYHPHARHGVLWPARIMHVSEIGSTSSSTKRSSSKNKVRAVFLAPYWNGRSDQYGGGRRVVETYGDNPSQAKNLFSSGPLLEVDTVEVSEDTIHKYPYEGEELNIDQLRVAFKFTGLPQPAFARFLDSHRLAMALKMYARCQIKPTRTAHEDTKAMSTLTDTHAMSITTPMFPPALLHLPFEYILAHLPPPAAERPMVLDYGDEALEPVLELNSVLDAMKPPKCWGHDDKHNGADPLATPTKSSPRAKQANSPAITSPRPIASNGDSHTDDSAWSLNNFASDYLLNEILEPTDTDSPFVRLGNDLALLVSKIRCNGWSTQELDTLRPREKLKFLLGFCLMTKSHGEDIVCLDESRSRTNSRKILSEWRRACERIYRKALLKYSTSGCGDGVTLIVTDSRCNEHLTVSGCVERPVRLPAALKGAKMAGAGSSPKVQIVFPVEDRYTDIAEKNVLPKAHKLSYLNRMKSRCVGLAPDAKGVPLTDDSDGQGGEDTMGSRGTYAAAVAGVAAALQAVDHIVGGRCVNAFCATRPPGHHAGRDLHPMKAVSNGFCVLNPVACAALYATTPQTEGGPGLRRVCVIDFDVHHGNGTQDILCSTYDPRFLYVSLHAGGAHINGYDTEDDDDASNFTPGSTQKNGIFPGRCGDTCPHDGVLNLPLGARVTAHDVGTVLVSQVGPAVDAFCPDLIILSAGFDAHKNDPLGMGGLSAPDFGSITDVACSMAFRSCSGRVLSILEGGYGIPCCRPQTDLFLPTSLSQITDENYISSQENVAPLPPPPPPQLKTYDLGGDLPDSMDDQLPAGLRRKVDKCHAEGFVECVCEHVRSLAKLNTRQI